MAYLFIRAPEALSGSELERATGIPQPTISREVRRLAGAGLLRTRERGRQLLVEAETDSTYYPELRALLLKALGPASVLREKLRRAEGLREAYVFGSWARRYQGEPGPPPADVDLLVVGDPEPDDVYAACRSAERALRLPVNPVIVSALQWRRAESEFLRSVRSGSLVPVVSNPE